MGVYDEFCLVEVLRLNTNVLISGEHITYTRTKASGNYWSGQVMATVRVTKDMYVRIKQLFAKHAFPGDLGECHHLEIATLRLHLGSGSVFRQRCKYSAILFDDCSIRVFYCLTVVLEYINHSVRTYQ